MTSSEPEDLSSSETERLPYFWSNLSA